MATLTIEGGAISEAMRVSDEITQRGIKEYCVRGLLPREGGGVHISIEEYDEQRLRQLLEEMRCKIKEVGKK